MQEAKKVLPSEVYSILGALVYQLIEPETLLEMADYGEGYNEVYHTLITELKSLCKPLLEQQK